MPQIIESYNIASRIELLVEEAEKEILFVSPVIQLTENLFIKFAEASTLGVKISILCGTAPDPAAARLLSVLKNLTVICAENMNARCYFNEAGAIITSMGLEDIENKSSLNTGIMLTVDNDHDSYNSMRQEVEAISRKGIRIILEPGSDEIKISSDVIYRGFCIGCGMPVTFNKARPFCNMCRKIFESHADDIPGNFCHSCGREYAVTLAENICITCKAS